jgi:hypothetical protein
VWLELDHPEVAYEFCGRTCSRLYRSVQARNPTATAWDFISSAAYSPSISWAYATPQLRSFVEHDRVSNLTNSSSVSTSVLPDQGVPVRPPLSDLESDGEHQEDSEDSSSLEAQLRIRIDEKDARIASLESSRDLIQM